MTTDSAPTQSTNENTQSQLAQAAGSVDQSLKELAQIQQAKNPDVKMQDPISPKALDMTQITSIDYNGPVENLLKDIATITNYKLNIIGNAPSIPVIVSVNEKNVTIAEILRNTTYQAAKQATIEAYPNTRVIELRYHSY